jgi:hypothetical protein
MSRLNGANDNHVAAGSESGAIPTVVAKQLLTTADGGRSAERSLADRTKRGSLTIFVTTQQRLHGSKPTFVTSSTKS